MQSLSRTGRRTRPSENGFTLLETLMATAFAVALLVGTGHFIRQFQISMVMDAQRRELALEAMRTTDTISQFLRHARADTVVLSGVAHYPWSQIAFDVIGMDGGVRHYTVGTANGGLDLVMTTQDLTTGVTNTQTLIQNHLSSVLFRYPRSDDPFGIQINFRLRTRTHLQNEVTLAHEVYVRLLSATAP